MRYKAVSCMSRSYRPTIPVSYITQVLGFTTPKNEECDQDSYGLGECVTWLKAHGACLIPDNSGEMLLDTKVRQPHLINLHLYIVSILCYYFLVGPVQNVICFETISLMKPMSHLSFFFFFFAWCVCMAFFILFYLGVGGVVGSVDRSIIFH